MPNETTTAAKILVILNHSIDFMADKAGVSRDEIIAAIEADPHGAAARRFTQLVMMGAAEYAA